MRGTYLEKNKGNEKNNIIFKIIFLFMNFENSRLQI